MRCDRPAIAVVVMLASATASAGELAVAGGFACARTHDGHVACWGSVPGGEQPSPWLVPGLADVAGVATAPGRVLAWTQTGELYEWNGTLARVAIKDVVDAAVSADAACARRRDSSVACWLGISLPDDALTGASLIAVAARRACVKLGDDVSCWTIGRDPSKAEIVGGAHAASSLAGYDRGTRGATFIAAVPHRVVAWTWADADGAARAVATPPLTDATAVAIGDTEACALGAALTCWADDAKPIARKLDVVGAKSIAVGAAVGCAAMPDHAVRCWGVQASVGDGIAAFTPTPVEVAGIADAAQLAVAGDRACVRRANGRVACWGGSITNDTRALAIDLVPREVPDLVDARELFVSYRRACARRSNGHVACWGLDGSAMHARPVDVPALARASWLGVVSADVCGLVDGKLECGAQDDAKPPPNATELWSGGWYRGAYLCARVTGAPALACRETWTQHGTEVSDTDFGVDLSDVVALRLPNGTELPWLCLTRKDGGGIVACVSMLGQSKLVTVDGVDGVTAITEGPPQQPGAPVHAFCAVTKDHAVACWSDPSTVWRVPAIGDAVETAGSAAIGCARRANGKVACWGDSDLVGNATRLTVDASTLVPGVSL